MKRLKYIFITLCFTSLFSIAGQAEAIPLHIDQCNSTKQCRTIYGNQATDCKNSRADNSICMCGSQACDLTVPPTPEPTPVTTPVTTPTPVATPVIIIDECNSTNQCQKMFGSQASDCKDSRSNNSICMCGQNACNSLTSPTPAPVVTPTPVVSPTPAVTPIPQITPSPIATPTPAPEITPNPGNGNSACRIGGNLEQWNKVALTCSGYHADESDEETFTDHRFNITFSQGNQTIVVPGHFAGDGNAANTSATSGNKWRAYFMPPNTGSWNYQVSFRQGNDLAVNLNENAGSAIAVFDGKSGQFTVGSSTVDAKDLRSQGLLRHLKGERYQRFSGSNKAFIEGGMGSPENIFGYYEFDNTSKNSGSYSCKGILHSFPTHKTDWNNGDPTWGGNAQKGKSLIGLINYLGGHDVNSVYIIPNTVAGDGCDAHPWVVYNRSGNSDKRNFDISKLDQWEIALSHMVKHGMLIHFMTQETENEKLLNNATLGLERKLFYRELISRFAHHPAVQWNLGEEQDDTAVSEQKAYANFIKATDPYDHSINLHTYPGDHHRYEPLLGFDNFDGPTIQYSGIREGSASNTVYGETIKWLDESEESGQQWYVTYTEAAGGDAPKPWEDVSPRQRIYWMWASTMSGGAGFAWYLKNDGSGDQHAYDLAVENLREFDNHWQQSGHLTYFYSQLIQDNLNIDLENLTRNNNITSTNDDWVLAHRNDTYIVFLREGGSTNINLPTSNTYSVNWYNPRTGKLTKGNDITGSGRSSIGSAPTQTNQDWVLIITSKTFNGASH